MFRSKVAVVLALAANVLADNQPPPLPIDSQIGLLAFPVTCQILGLNQTFKTVFAATAPAYYGAGQDIYYTDTVGTIEIPKNIIQISKLLAPTATCAEAQLNVSLKISNASPANPQVFSATLSGIPLQTENDTIFRVPEGNGTLPPIGPITLGEPNKSSRISLGNISAALTLQDASGDSVLGPIPLFCGPQNVEFILGSVSVDDTTGPPYAPANGYLPDYPVQPNLNEYGFFRFNYLCDFGGGPQALDLTIGGQLPVYFTPGQPFYFTEVNNYLRLPPSLLDTARAVPNATTISTNVSNFGILLTNGSPATFNAASPPIISLIDLTKDDSVLPIPQNGYLTVGPMYAGPDGTITGIGLGNATATATLLDPAGNTLLTLPVQCYPSAPLELIGIPVSAIGPGNYSLGINQNS